MYTNLPDKLSRYEGTEFSPLRRELGEYLFTSVSE